MLLAVLETRCGMGLGMNDVFLNVAGGLRISEPAADLAVAAALVSARQDIPFPRDVVVFGEVSLSGALRPAVQAEARLREATKLGFTAAFAPAGAPPTAGNDLTIHPVADLAAFMDKCFGKIER
jgi:DNA repair protein RadA/Sms